MTSLFKNGFVSECLVDLVMEITPLAVIAVVIFLIWRLWRGGMLLREATQ
jgi:hypothetical protein